MEANVARFASVLFLLLAVVVLASASADSGYVKSEKPDVSKERSHGEKLNPKIPAKPLITKEEHVVYEKTSPKKPKEEHVSYEKSDPKLPTKPVIPKEEHHAYEKNNPKLPSKPVIPKEEHGAYENNKPKSLTKTEKPLQPKVLEHPKNVAVQGLVYCKQGSKLIPLQGATTRVTCSAVHKSGYGSTSFSFLSCPADEKGYFLAKIPSWNPLKDDIWKIIKCKAFLENSPWRSCKVPEDTNGGITGAHLTFSRHLNRDGYCLSSVGPFIYNPGHESLPKKGY
ncbi:hypothetical protein QVD17_15401 [Tagetes erecta]|uniref:Uncharacterized protein n=1 Tax=Tagetes erecta TaxID=13708 RepID=A0AAD8NZH7_TARER|nr:hypothetical protein QVD17_15401 [Tagetes erecta]